MHLTLEGFVWLSAFTHVSPYFIISLGVFHIYHLPYHYIEQSISFIHLEEPTGRSSTNKCSTSALNELKYACESVLFLLKLKAIGLQLF